MYKTLFCNATLTPSSVSPINLGDVSQDFGYNTSRKTSKQKKNLPHANQNKIDLAFYKFCRDLD